MSSGDDRDRSRQLEPLTPRPRDGRRRHQSGPTAARRPARRGGHGLTCPECGGALWEHDENGLLRFKCHVGHAYSVDSLESDQSNALEGTMWAALRSLQERRDLLRRLSRRAGGDARLDAKARKADEHAGVAAPRS